MIRFEKFNVSPYDAPDWLPPFLTDAFLNPKEKPMWDYRKPDQKTRLDALATGIVQFLKTLPDGAEIGTADLAKKLNPEYYDDPNFRHWIIGRIERCRFAGIITGYYRSMPDERWKVPRTFYKYHNGKGS